MLHLIIESSPLPQAAKWNEYSIYFRKRMKCSIYRSRLLGIIVHNMDLKKGEYVMNISKAFAFGIATLGLSAAYPAISHAETINIFCSSSGIELQLCKEGSEAWA